MKMPIIVVRQHNLFVLPAFDGVISDGAATTRHNLRENYVQHVIDSDGAHWALTLEKTNHRGIRRAFSATIMNVSTDYYHVVSHAGITIEEFRRIIAPKARAANPDTRELAHSLLKPLAGLPGPDSLSKHILLLNL